MLGKLDYITRLIATAVLPALLAGCSDEFRESDGSDGDAATVTFRTCLDAGLGTRAISGNELFVDRVVCAVFADGRELPALRDTILITDADNIVYSPCLAKGGTYKVTFWAMKDDAYNVTDMTDISPKRAAGMSYTGKPETYECFTGCSNEFTVSSSNMSQDITLTRPMARVNLGITAADMQAVEALGYTPTKVKVTFNFAQSYSALLKTYKNVVSQTMTSDVTGGTLTIGGADYTAIASFMVFTDNTVVDLTYTVYGTKNGNEEAIITQTISNVPISVNKNTNIVGSLITRTENMI